MKKFKTTDMYISIALIIIFTIYGLWVANFNFLIGYFVVGGWQIISMLVHAFNHWFTRKGTRRIIYHYAVFIIFLLVCLSFIFQNALLVIALPLLFVSPVLAVYYTYICYDELTYKMNETDESIKE